MSLFLGRYLLDSNTLESLGSDPSWTQEAIKCVHSLRAALEQQRTVIQEDLRAALSGATEDFAFSSWRRRIDFQYSLSPLSAKGSKLSDPGGRFNIGQIESLRYRPFGALYLASDAATALVEAVGGASGDKPEFRLELALQRPASFTVCSVSGSVHECLDISQLDRLKQYAELMKGLTIPSDIHRWMRQLGIPPINVINSARELVDGYMAENWREIPALFDLPAPSQEFGQRVEEAGIEAIRFVSVRTGAPCLAVFPVNFVESDSFVELDDDPPSGSEVIRRLDRHTWRDLV